MTNKTAITFAVSALVVAVFVIGVIIWRSAGPVDVKAPSISPIAGGELRNPLTGTKLAAPLSVLPQVTAVMVENSSDAWPLAGLDQAFLVIEAPAEGMIPRFEAFFAPDATVPKIGPVRSARPYYIAWAAQFGALYAHVGGSPEALEKLKTAAVTDFDQFFNGSYFYRDEVTRRAPHNVYTSLATLLGAEIDKLQLPAPQYSYFTFKDGVASGQATSLQVDWTSASAYDFVWQYDAASNEYTREQGRAADGRTVTTGWLENGAQAKADNLVFMETDMKVLDAKGRRFERTTGTGKALLAQDGAVQSVTWSKASDTAPLKFLDSAGNEIKMNAGKTWLEVVPSLSQVTLLGG